MSLKSKRQKPYGCLQSLPVSSHKWKDLSMDFVTGLPKSKDWRGVKYDSILVIFDRLTKMVHYEPLLTTLDTNQLAKILIEMVIKYHGLPESIVTDRGSLFTSKFWSSLCYYLNDKRRLSTAFHPQTNGQTKRQNGTMKAYLRAYYRFEQDEWVRWLAMAEFAYNNSGQASTMMSPSKALLGYHPRMSYEDNRDLRSKSRAVDENAAPLRDLMKELKVNLTESPELQTLYHNKHVKERSYRPGESIRLSTKNIKTKRNPKLDHRYLGPFEIVEAVENQAYKLKLHVKWHIHLVFQTSLLEKDVKKREAVDQKIADQLKFEEEEQREQEVDSIMESMVFVEEAIDGRPLGLYYLIHWKRETHAEDTWEPIKGTAHLRRLLKKYHAENPDKPTATSPPVDKGAPPPPMAARSGAKVALPIILRKRAPTENPQPMRNRMSEPMNPPVRVRHNRRRWKPTSRF